MTKRWMLLPAALLLVAAAPANREGLGTGFSSGQTVPAPDTAALFKELKLTWVAQPSAADLARLRPPGVKTAGSVLVHCRFTSRGKLFACSVRNETPPGQGFGAAALKAAKLYKVEAEDHSDIPDRDVEVTVDFPAA